MFFVRFPTADKIWQRLLFKNVLQLVAGYLVPSVTRRTIPEATFWTWFSFIPFLCALTISF